MVFWLPGKYRGGGEGSERTGENKLPESQTGKEGCPRVCWATNTTAHTVGIIFQGTMEGSAKGLVVGKTTMNEGEGTSSVC